MSISSGLNAALNGDTFRFFVAMQIELPSYTVNLLDGDAEVTFSVDGEQTTFTGEDPNFGRLISVEPITEAIATSSPRMTFTMQVPSNYIASIGNGVANQNSRVRVWFGTINESTGAVSDVPELLWSGRYDILTVNVDRNYSAVEIETVSAFDRLFVSAEGERLNGHWHKSIWGDTETGLDYNIDATQDLIWGAAAPPKGMVSAPGQTPYTPPQQYNYGGSMW